MCLIYLKINKTAKLYTHKELVLMEKSKTKYHEFLHYRNIKYVNLIAKCIKSFSRKSNLSVAARKALEGGSFLGFKK